METILLIGLLASTAMGAAVPLSALLITAFATDSAYPDKMTSVGLLIQTLTCGAVGAGLFWVIAGR